MRKVAIVLIITSSFVFAQNTYVPDDKFEQALIDLGYDTTLDDYVLTANISSVTDLNVDGKEISDLTGIEAFTSLTSLSCHNNKLTSLDVSSNTNLTHLNCDGNQLTSLDVSKNTALTEIILEGNQLTSLDINSNTSLVHLNCTSNKLTSLDVSNNTALTWIEFIANQLTSLDLSKNTALLNIDGWDNALASLDVSNNTALIELNVNNNSLTSMDVSKNTALTKLTINKNQLTSLDVTKNTALETLMCARNQLTSLDVKKNTALTTLDCSENQLTSLDVSSNTALEHLYCSENQLTSLDVSNNTALAELVCGFNQLTALDVSNNTALILLRFNHNQLTSLDVSSNTALGLLDGGHNSLTSLDVSNNTALHSLHIDDNQLTYFNMKNGVTDGLEYFHANNNSLTCIETLDPDYATANWISSNGNIDIDAGVTFAVICGGTDLTTWHVSATGSDGSGSGTETSPLATIQTGINATSTGDTVLVAAGTYNESVLIGGKNISLISEKGRDSTIIDALNISNGRPLTVLNVTDSVKIKGFTLTNGNRSSGADAFAGGLYVEGSKGISLRNLIVDKNTTAGSGGGIGINSCTYPVTLDSIIISNNKSSDHGGGLQVIYTDSINVSNLIIKNNTAVNGGGIQIGNSKANLTNITVSGNTATVRGGGIYNSHNITLTNVTISNNKATNDTGGGIYTTSGTLIVNNSIIWNNFRDEINGDATVTYSNIKGGYTGTGNIDADPLFCDTLSYKYYATSPVVGTGENGVNMGAGGIGCDVPQAFEWVSSALDTINITKTNLTDTYTAQWTESKDVYGDSINYLVYAKVGVYPAEEIYDTTVTSVSITYQEILEGVFEGSPVNGATVSLNVKATDGIDTVNVTGDNRVIYVNRYEYLSTEGEAVPVEFALHENYPNPFNPTTTLRFDLPVVSSVTLTIYNMLGQKVKTFNMQRTPAGHHSLKWNATNDYGDPVAAGVYLYQLQTKDFVKTRKMVLLK